jgi:hypothetical protein
MAAAAKEIREAYRVRYEGKLTQMERKSFPAHLVAVTTTSAYGKSSLYNRVVFEKGGQRHKVTESLGVVQGFGVFQFSESTYQCLKEFVKQEFPGRQVTGFGAGPRVKWQVIKLATHRQGQGRRWLCTPTGTQARELGKSMKAGARRPLGPWDGFKSPPPTWLAGRELPPVSTDDTPPCVGPRFVAVWAPRCGIRPWPWDNGDEIGNRMGD